MSKQKRVVETQVEMFPVDEPVVTVDDVVEAEAELMDEKVEQVDENFHIEISHKLIGGEPVNAVSARELHAKLGSKQQYVDWFRNRVLKYDFLDGVDFIFHKSMKVQFEGEREVSRPFMEHFISLDMAKELSMVENNEQGKRARRYFI